LPSAPIAIPLLFPVVWKERGRETSPYPDWAWMDMNNYNVVEYPL